MSIIEKLIKSLSRALKKSAQKSLNSNTKAIKKEHIPANLKTFLKHQEFLNSRWAEAGRLAEKDEITSFGAWYYDDPTSAQLKKIESLELYGLIPQSKGSASDIIGLFSEPSREDREFLQFFKAFKADMTEIHAREAIRVIRLDPSHSAKWTERPPLFEHKVFFKVTGKKPASIKTAIEAAAFINEMCKENQDNDARWQAINSLWDDLQDRETRADYDLKSVSKTTFLNTIGEYLNQLDDMEDYDLGEFADFLLEKHPDLEREG